MKKIFLLVLIIGSFTAQAQKVPGLVHRGKVKWERKMNMFSYLDEISKNGNAGF